MNIKVDLKTHHQCSSQNVGDELIFTCNLCPNYRRILNYKTGKWKTEGNDFNILHSGITRLPTLDQTINLN